MMLLRATPLSYAKVDKVDADEARHWKAQYLIHKALEHPSCGAPAPAPAATRWRPAVSARPGACRPRAGNSKATAAVRIVVRLKRLRLAARCVRLRVCRSVQRHVRSLRRLVRGGERLGSHSSS